MKKSVKIKLKNVKNRRILSVTLRTLRFFRCYCKNAKLNVKFNYLALRALQAL